MKCDTDRFAFSVEESDEAISATAVGNYLKVATVRYHLLIDHEFEVFNMWTIRAYWVNRA